MYEKYIINISEKDYKMIINLFKAKSQVKELEECISKLYESKKEINLAL